ncbi:Uncharacterised protein [Bordetella ansorpii]|uniref:Uncharacterized protein n=1 Tax=Bordetella ansorpii TaxID=288768 RepID=A0A157RLX3_9BORD|nr:hypothetical protein [Bordetella ansorpii]SAI59000.1 Uncharacterised protein [Bordetella ansorpii]
MTRDLFGTVPGAMAVRRESGQAVAVMTDQERAEPVKAQLPSITTFYRAGGRSFTREELLRMSGWHEQCRQDPQGHYAVMFTVEGDRYSTALIKLVVEDGGMPAGWRHGEIAQVWIERPSQQPAANAGHAARSENR